jgi:hypothetical protein
MGCWSINNSSGRGFKIFVVRPHGPKVFRKEMKNEVYVYGRAE